MYSGSDVGPRVWFPFCDDETEFAVLYILHILWPAASYSLTSYLMGAPARATSQAYARRSPDRAA
jgi:hypothetical protein